MFTRSCLAAATVGLMLSLAACGGADVKSEISTTTKGQQLLDLKKAHEAGALTAAEYEAERKKVLNAD
ncbi:MAG TPA: hypothetical protein VF096_00585 [Azonexus sp.]